MKPVLFEKKQSKNPVNSLPKFDIWDNNMIQNIEYYLVQYNKLVLIVQALSILDNVNIFSYSKNMRYAQRIGKHGSSWKLNPSEGGGGTPILEDGWELPFY